MTPLAHPLRTAVPKLAFLLAATAPWFAAAYAETVTVYSGSSAVSWAANPGPAVSITPTHCNNAASGFTASPTAVDPAWKTTLTHDTTAKWVNTGMTAGNENETWSVEGLYAAKFSVPQADPAATIKLWYLVDDALGGGVNAGLYLNGLALPNSSDAASPNHSGADRFQQHTVSLNAGQNVLVLNATSTAGAAGVIFTLEVTTVPEPSTLALLTAGSALLLRRRKRH